MSTATATASAPASAPTNVSTPRLWPQPIPIIGVTGPIGSGKTLFGLSIDPTRTLIYDEENSSASYEHFGATRVDIHKELNSRYSRTGFKPIDAFEWWLSDVRSRPRGKFTVVMLDTAGLIENGLVEWVEAHPEHFGHTASQHRVQNGAIKWGDVSKHWKMIALDLAARCETFVFTVHQAEIFSGDQRTGKFRPKGNKVLMEIAHVYLQLERKADSKGNQPQKPSAVVLKSRLVSAPKFNEKTGELDMLRILPPRMPVATPAAIRSYFLSPAGDKLDEKERVVEEKMSDDERLQMQERTAQAVLEAERIREHRQSANRSQSPAPSHEDQKISKLGKVGLLRTALWAGNGKTEDENRATWAARMQSLGVTSARDLTPDQIDELIKKLEVEVSSPAPRMGPPPPPGGRRPRHQRRCQPKRQRHPQLKRSYQPTATLRARCRLNLALLVHSQLLSNRWPSLNRPPTATQPPLSSKKSPDTARTSTRRGRPGKHRTNKKPAGPNSSNEISRLHPQRT